jgi:hypothetical protein
MRVWSELHDAVRYSRYFNQKASDMASTHRLVLIAHAVLAAGVLTVLLDAIPHGIVAVFSSLCIAALSIWLLLSNYAEKLAAVHRMCEYADDIEHQYRALWDDIESYAIGHEDAKSRLAAIEHVFRRADDLFRRTGFVIDDDLNDRSADSARDLLQRDYAPATASKNAGAAAT